MRLPVAGGGYIRLLPTRLTERVVQGLNSRQVPMVTYFHPYEFDTRRLDVFETTKPENLTQRVAGWRMNLHQNFLRGTVTPKVRAWLESFPFTSFENYLRDREIHECSSLL